MKVAVLIGNDVEVDARVRKYLRTFAAAGLDVVGVGLLPPGHPGDEIEVDGVRVLRRAIPAPRSAQVAGQVAEPADAPAAGPEATPVRRGTAVRALGLVRRKVRGARAKAARIWRQRPVPRALERTGPLGREQQLEMYLRHPQLARWEQVLPELTAYETVFGPLLDELAPDVVHPHDVFLLGVAVRYKRRAAAEGRPVRLVYDAREYLPGLPNPPARVTAAYVDHEREFLPEADRVITVSDPIADELQRTFQLPRRPALVLNAPIVDPPAEPRPSVRAAAGIGGDERILLYGGGLAEPRGVHTVVEALPAMPGVHLVVVARAPSHYTRRLVARADELGCANRYHEVGFVDPAQVVTYFESATVGITPLLHAGNHDWALTNKFCEYVVAGLPVVTSDTEVQARLVEDLAIGTVFVAGDVPGCAAAVREVLADLERYRSPLADDAVRLRFSWPAQADVLLELYRELLGPLPVDGGPPAGVPAGVPADVTDGAPAVIEEPDPRRPGDETMADAPPSDPRGTAT